MDESNRKLPEPLHKFLEYIREGRTEATVIGYRIDLLQFASFLKGVRNRELLEARTKDVQEFLKWLKEEGRTLKTIHRKLTSIKGFYAWVKNNLGIPVSINEDELKLPKATETLPEILTVEQVKSLIAAAGNERDKALFLLLYDTAARVGEIRELNINEIDWEKNTYKLNNRLLFFSDDTKIALLQYLRIRHEEADHIFISNRGNPISERRIQTVIQETAQKAGIEKWTELSANVLRHSRAVHLLDGGLSIDELARFLGINDMRAMAIYKELSYHALINKVRGIGSKLF